MKKHDFLLELTKEIGGDELVGQATNILYKTLLLDDRVNSFFQGKNVDNIESMQKQLLCSVLSPHYNYNGRSLREIHKKLVLEQGLNDFHFDVVTEHILSAFRKVKVGDNIIDLLMNHLESTRKEVLNR